MPTRKSEEGKDRVKDFAFRLPRRKNMSFNIKRLAVVSLSYFILISVFLYFYFHGIPRPDNLKRTKDNVSEPDAFTIKGEDVSSELSNGERRQRSKPSAERKKLPRTVKNKKQGNFPERRWDDKKQEMVSTKRVLGKEVETRLSSPYFNPFYMRVENPFPKNLLCYKAPWNINWYTVRDPDTYALLTPKSCYTTVDFKDVYHLDNVPLDDASYMNSKKGIPLRILKLDLASTINSQPPVWLEVQRWWIRELRMKALGFYIPDMLAMSENSMKNASVPGSLPQAALAEEATDISEDGFLFVRSKIGEEEQKKYMRWHFWVAPAEGEWQTEGIQKNAWFYAEPDEDKLFEYMEYFKSVYGYYPAYARF